MLSRQHAGAIEAPSAAGTDARFDCGCYVRFTLSITGEKVIAGAGFQTNGCGFMVSSAGVAAESITGRKLTELHSLDKAAYLALLERSIGKLPADRLACVGAVLDSLRAALTDYRSRVIEEFAGEKQLICTCFGVSEETIERLIATKRPASVDEVSSGCRAGSGCGSCRMLIREMIDTIHA